MVANLQFEMFNSVTDLAIVGRRESKSIPSLPERSRFLANSKLKSQKGKIFHLFPRKSMDFKFLNSAEFWTKGKEENVSQ